MTPLSAFPVAPLPLAGTVTLLWVDWETSAASPHTLLHPKGWKINPKPPHLHKNPNDNTAGWKLAPQWQQGNADERGLPGRGCSQALKVWDSWYNLQSVILGSPSRALLQLPTGNCKFPLNHRELQTNHQGKFLFHHRCFFFISLFIALSDFQQLFYYKKKLFSLSENWYKKKSISQPSFLLMMFTSADGGKKSLFKQNLLPADPKLSHTSLCFHKVSFHSNMM